MGGLASAYAGGGAVMKFNTGGTTPNTPTPTATGAGGIPQDVSRTSTLSPWVGDYVTNALGQGAALAQAPYQAYQGPLTAGASGLQQQAFAGASEIAEAGYTPGQFTGGFNASTAQQYMNPYLQASLDPQMKEMKRQSDIARMEDATRLTKAGAYGGSRQAIMESEGRRNLLDKQTGVLGAGYKTAYDLGLGQFNKEREADEASRQFGANFGIKSVGQLADLGAQQRAITGEGMAADKAQFEEQRDFAYSMPKYQLGLLSGLPTGANTTSVDQDAMSKMQSTLSGLRVNYKTLDAALKALGQTPT
jgi:preprotein translocase subunit SecG